MTKVITMTEEYKIEEIIEDASNISNAELYDVLEDNEHLVLIFNDYLDKEDEFIRDIKGHFSGFQNKKITIYKEEKPFMVECAILKSEL